MSIEEMMQMVACCISASRRSISDEQIEWLLQERIRSDYFERVMFHMEQK